MRSGFPLWDAWDGSWDRFGTAFGTAQSAKSTVKIGLGRVGRLPDIRGWHLLHPNSLLPPFDTSANRLPFHTVPINPHDQLSNKFLRRQSPKLGAGPIQSFLTTKSEPEWSTLKNDDAGRARHVLRGRLHDLKELRETRAAGPWSGNMLRSSMCRSPVVATGSTCQFRNEAKHARC